MVMQEHAALGAVSKKAGLMAITATALRPLAYAVVLDPYTAHEHEQHRAVAPSCGIAFAKPYRLATRGRAIGARRVGLGYSPRRRNAMRHRLISAMVLFVAALAVLAWSATPASAQRWGWRGQGYGDGYGGWGSYRSGYNYGPSYGYYGRPYYGGGYSSYYNPGGYASGSCCCDGSDGYAYGGQPSGYTSFYSGTTGDNMNAVRINVHVPPDARVFFDGEQTSEQGGFRQFVSPALEPNENYTYEIKASWMENGQPVERTRKFRVRPGQRLDVDFLAMGQRRASRSNEELNMPPRPEERQQQMPRSQYDQNKPPH
jgi:uncharacterized protein (TIGR03000 family)